MSEALGALTAAALPPLPPPPPRADLADPDELVRCAEELWQAVLAGDELTAGDVVFDALEDGHPPESVLLEVIAPTQLRVGAEWAANRMSVAQEHAATAINDRVIAALALHPDLRDAARGSAREGGARGRVTVACVEGEWHAFPARLLAEVLKLRGWRVDYLGAQVPTPHLIDHLHRTAPDAVALSASLATRLPSAHAAITACQAAGVPVLAGGPAFGPGGRYARQLGADAWAGDARGAAARLAAGLPRPLAEHRADDDLPHLADQEFTLVARASERLVGAVMAGLEERFPAVRSYSALQRQHTAEDVAHIVDYLGVALYVDDPGLFTDFLGWTAGILAARAVPPASLLPALGILAEELHDLPRARSLLLDHGRDAVLARVRHGGAEHTGTEPSRTEPGGTEQSRTEPGGTEQSRTEPGGDEQARTEPPPERARATGLPRPRPASADEPGTRA